MGCTQSVPKESPRAEAKHDGCGNNAQKRPAAPAATAATTPAPSQAAAPPVATKADSGESIADTKAMSLCAADASAPTAVYEPSAAAEPSEAKVEESALLVIEQEAAAPAASSDVDVESPSVDAVAVSPEEASSPPSSRSAEAIPHKETNKAEIVADAPSAQHLPAVRCTPEAKEEEEGAEVAAAAASSSLSDGLTASCATPVIVAPHSLPVATTESSPTEEAPVVEAVHAVATADTVDDDDANWEDCATCDVSREASPEATMPGGGSLAAPLASSRAVSTANPFTGGGERLIIKAVRKGTRATRGGGGGSATKKGSGAAAAFLPINDESGEPSPTVFGPERPPALSSASDGAAATARHSSGYYSSLRLGAPLRFRTDPASPLRPLSGMGWTCRPATTASVLLPSAKGRGFAGGLHAASASSFSRASARPIAFEVQMVRPDGTTVGATRVVGGVAARLIRGATGCGVSGASVAIQQAELAREAHERNASRAASLQATLRSGGGGASEGSGASQPSSPVSASAVGAGSGVLIPSRAPSFADLAASNGGGGGGGSAAMAAAFVIQRNGYTAGFPYAGSKARAGKATSSLFR